MTKIAFAYPWVACVWLASALFLGAQTENQQPPAAFQEEEPAQETVPEQVPAPEPEPEPAEAEPMEPTEDAFPEPAQPSDPTAPAPIEPPAELRTNGVTPDQERPTGVPEFDPNDLDPQAGAARARDFDEADVGQTLRLLARQARVNLVVSDQITGTVTMRLEDVTAMEAIEIIAQAQNLFIEELNNVFYVKTQAERAAEPRESAFFTFSFARATDVAPLLERQLQSGSTPQVDPRINTIFYSEVRSNLDNIKSFLEVVDRPTKQVMIEARLIEVSANPQQRYGINWSGVFDNTTIRYGGSPFPDQDGQYEFEVVDGRVQLLDQIRAAGRNIHTQPGFVENPLGELTNRIPMEALQPVFGQFAILSVPQLSVTLNLINQDSDAEFLANPRIVTADNQEATIRIITSQPVPQLNFNEQTATAVFGGFEEREFGNTLVVLPQVNQDNFVTLRVRPEISNKVRDEPFTFAGATVRSPVVDTRSLESQVMIQSGDTLAIGGLLQDQTTHGRTKVPILGDIPIIGYLFTERINSRQKRNLLIFITPTVIDERYGTGLENQVTGLSHSGEEFADPSGWRNNARGSVRLVPTSERSLASEYPVPGIPEQPEASSVRFQDNAKPRRR